MSIQRYNCEWDFDHDDIVFDIVNDGTWVKYKDHQSKVAELEAENESLKKSLEITEKSRDIDCVVSDSYRDELERVKAENERLREQFRWRSVEDELPEINKHVLACGPEFNQSAEMYYTGSKLLPWCFADGEEYLNEDITHWLPLPPAQGGE